MHMTEYPVGIVQLVSAYDFPSTLNRLSDAFERAHIQIFARIDHRAAAAQVGLSMPPTTVLIYGNPQSGTPLMLATPIVALDLPMRVLVREDPSGRTMVAYHPAASMTNLVVLTEAQLAGFSKAETLIANAITGQ
jgi:uncharacterized protein (DUF302 family)